MRRDIEHTIEHLARNTSHVLLDNGVINRDYDLKDIVDADPIRRDFCRYVGNIKNVDQFDLDRLKPQLQHSTDLNFLIHSLDNVSMVDSTLQEFGRYLNHLLYMRKVFRNKIKRSNKKLKGDSRKKANMFFDICDEYNRIYDCLSRRIVSTSFSDESSFVKIRKHMEENKLHLPRGVKFRKRNGRTNISEADLNLVAQSYHLALKEGNGVVVISSDMDVINLIYNFGADYNLGRINGELNGGHLQQRVSVFYPGIKDWTGYFNCLFKANSEGLTYDSIRGPWYWK